MTHFLKMVNIAAISWMLTMRLRSHGKNLISLAQYDVEIDAGARPIGGRGFRRCGSIFLNIQWNRGPL
jgi:hypothetical protein